MEIFVQLERTSTGRPALLEGEVECYSQESINLYDGEEKTRYRGGRCVVTTHRLFWINDSQNIAMCLSLSHIIGVSKEAGFLTRSGKLKIDVKLHDGRTNYIKLSFKEGGRDDMQPRLQQALSRKTWENIGPSILADKRLEKREFSTADAGIAGIMRRQETGQKQMSELASQAFTDLNGLMSKARDVVGVIERYAATLATSESKQSDDDANEFNALLLTMGIASPVTKENAGAAYHKELSRQLAQFLSKPLTQAGGIMSLSDVYCLFNRARGTELISPDDLYQSAHLLEKLRLNMHLRKFEGGLVVIQLDSHSEKAIGQRLQQIANQSAHGYITATEASSIMNISITLAAEYLRSAERHLYLCRDDSLEGLSFYTNLFPSFQY